MDIVLEAKNLTKVYGSGEGTVHALRGVSVGIERGSFTAIIGKSGCGKTTLLKMINKLNSIDSGDILIDSTSVSEIPVSELPKKIGYVVQEGGLFPHMTVRENVEYGLRVRKIGGDEARRRVDRRLASFGIDGIADRYPGVISGGEAQRTALARALVLEPEILLLDEPFSALDPATKRQMYGVVREVHKRFDCTIVFVTHDFEEARILADKVGIVLDGSLRTVRDADCLFDADGLDDDVLAFLDIDNATS